MWDLTIPGNGDHDFYVLPAPRNGHHTYHGITEPAPVLVHNCTPGFVSDALDELASKRPTVGRIFDSEGNPLGIEDGVHELSSGTDSLSAQTSSYLHEAAADGNMEPIHPLGKYPLDRHVESKYATWMRDNGITDANVVINHPEGICDNVLNCTDGVRAILPRGSVMKVWAPGAAEPVPLEGVAELEE